MLRLAVRVRRDQAELVLAGLLDLAPSGVEEVAVGDGVVEYAVYGAPGELPALPDVKAVAGDALVDVSSSEVPDDWEQRWRSFHRPLVLEGGRLSVRPPWEAVLGSEIELVIDPGQAFGTGGHATTRLCLELMLSMPARGPFLDLGCGSGVLAIAAARLGWSPVVAVDFDPLAVAAAEANAGVNGVSIEARRHDLRSDPVEAAPTVAANLLRPLLLAWAARLGEAPAGDARPGVGAPDSVGARPGVGLPDRVIASGLLVGEADEIAGAFRSVAGLRESARRVSGEWAALLLERGPRSPAPFSRERRRQRGQPQRAGSCPPGRCSAGAGSASCRSRCEADSVSQGGEPKLPNPLAIGVTLGGLLLDVVAPRPKPRAGFACEPLLLSPRAVSRTPQQEAAHEEYDIPPAAGLRLN